MISTLVNRILKWIPHITEIDDLCIYKSLVPDLGINPTHFDFKKWQRLRAPDRATNPNRLFESESGSVVNSRLGLFISNNEN